MLTNPCDRIAAGLVAQQIRVLLMRPDEASIDADPLSPVCHLVHLHHRYLASVKRRLEKLLAKFERDAELPERMIEWRELLENPCTSATS